MIKIQRNMSYLDKPVLTRRGDWLFVSFAEPQIMLSWAVVNGGRVTSDTVAWFEVRPGDLHPEVDPASFLENRLRAEGRAGAVGLMTSRRLDTYSCVEMNEGNISVSAIATVGLSNALRAGDPAGGGWRCGTINVLCHSSRCLTDKALLEGLSIAVEARTAAVMEDPVESSLSAGSATGTGTDCLVMSASRHVRAGEEPERYAGKHTPVGALIGAAVFEAVKKGVAAWKKERHAKERIQP
jgi:adenosylcobinamide amidohydrolase